MQDFWKYLLLLFLSALSGNALIAQVSPGLHLSRDVWNSRTTNPAIVQPYNLAVGLIGVGNDLHLDGITYGSVLQEQGDKLVIDAGVVLGALGDRAGLRERAEVPTLGVSAFVGDFNLSISHAVVFDARIDLPREFAELLWLGNAPFVGQTVNLASDFRLQNYHRVQLGAAYALTEGLTLGVNANLLSGISALETERFDLALTTDNDIYALTLDTDLAVNSFGALDYNGLDDIRLESPANRLTFDNFLASPSATVDLGLRYQTENWDWAVSLLNVTNATLDWNDDAVSYTGNRSFTYGGIDGNAAIVDGEAIDFNTALDTLTSLLDVTTDRNVSFRTALPQRAYLSGIYQFGNAWEFGAAFAWERFAADNTVAATALARYRFLDTWRVGASYGFHRDGFDQLGLQAYGQLGPVQLYALTEDLIGLLDLENARRVHFRLGINLLFGER